MGFEIGDYITVSCEEGKLIITPDAEKAAMAKAEAEFMEKGMKKLQKRFQAEKEQLHAQFVAEEIQNITEERCSDYGKDYCHRFTKRWRG